MGQPHKHAELIKAWAENQSIVLQTKDATGQWVDCPNPRWFDASEYRIKPEPPKSYVTQLSFSESMPNVDYSKLKSVSIGGIEFVPAAMLEEVARDAAAYGYNQAGGHVGLYLGSDFYDLIAKVKEGK